MNLFGLGLGQVAAVFGAAALAMTLLYVLKLRRRRVAVPFLPLWEKILAEKDATTLFSRLKRVFSLLLQLALLLALAFALGDPRTQNNLMAGRSMVVLVDASASMQAVEDGKSRFERAREATENLAKSLGGSDKMMVAQMAVRTVARTTMTQDTPELLRGIKALAPTDARADLPRALRFALDSLRGLDGAEIVVISDGALGDSDEALSGLALGKTKLSMIHVGDKLSNVGITEFSVRRYPLDRGRYEVMLKLSSTFTEPEEVELSLYGDGQLIDVSKLWLKPGEELPRFYPSLGGASRQLEARIRSAHDNLPADNRAFAVLPERRHLKVWVVTQGNTYLEAAMLIDEYVDAEVLSPADYAKRIDASNSVDFIVFDAVTPLRAPKAHALYLDPRGEGSPVQVGAEIASPGFDKVMRNHPVTRFLALDDVNIAKGHKLTPRKDDKVLGASSEGALLIAGERDGKRFVALGFDPRDSDLPMRTAWPLFLINVLQSVTDDEATQVSGYRNGQIVNLPAPLGVSSATLTDPQGVTSQLAVVGGRVLAQTERSGIYHLGFGTPTVTSLPTAVASSPNPVASTTLGASSSDKIMFASNVLDRGESTDAPKSAITVGGRAAEAVSVGKIGVERTLWVYLLLAVCLISVFEWISYHRRVTV
jgi:von Willebrand factor type A domain/Aerotolerance regulator N-terminal